MVVQGWYPLGGRGHTADLLGNEVISEIAEVHGKSSAQVILRWNLQKGVAVIPGSSNPDHIQENTELFDFALTDGEMAQINALDRNEKPPNPPRQTATSHQFSSDPAARKIRCVLSCIERT